MNAFEVGVTLTLFDHVSGALGVVAAQFARTQTAATALQSKMNAIGSTFRQGALLMGGGMALAAPLAYATHQAMELQTALGRVQIATHASNEQMAQMNDILTKTANVTGVFSKPKLAAFAADMYSSGIRDVTQINEMLPLFAKGADIMKILSHNKISPEEAAHTFSALAHQFGRYDAKSMSPIVEAAAAMAPALPGGLKTLKGMGSYVNIMGSRALGIDPVQLMSLQAAVAQTSGGQGTGRGALSGANLINFLQRSMPGNFGAGLLSGKSAFAAATMGLGDKYGAATTVHDGRLDLQLLQQKIAAFEKLSTVEIAKRMLSNVDMLGKKASEELPLIQRAISTGGKGVDKSQLLTQLMKYQYGSAGTMGMLMGDEKFVNMLASIQGAVKTNVKAGGIDTMQAEAMKMLEPQLMRLQTNFSTLASTIGMQLIPVITPIVTRIGDILDAANTFAAAHPKIVQAITGVTAAAAGLMVLGGVGKIMQAAFMGLKFLASPAAQAVWKVISAFRLLTPTGLAVTAAIVGLIIVVKNWDKIMDFAKSKVDWIKVAIVMCADAANTAIGAFQKLGAAIGGLIANIGGAINVALKSMNLPQLPDFSKLKPDQGVLDYSNKRLAQMGMLKGIDDWAASRKTTAADARLFVPPPIKNNVVPFTQQGIKVAQAAVRHETTNNHRHDVKIGDIHVHAAPGQDPKAIADQVYSHVSKKMADDAVHASRSMSRASGIRSSSVSNGMGR